MQITAWSIKIEIVYCSDEIAVFEDENEDYVLLKKNEREIY